MTRKHLGEKGIKSVATAEVPPVGQTSGPGDPSPRRASVPASPQGSGTTAKEQLLSRELLETQRSGFISSAGSRLKFALQDIFTQMPYSCKCFLSPDVSSSQTLATPSREGQEMSSTPKIQP